LNLGEILDYTSKKVQSDIAMIRNATRHAGAKGTSFEEVVRQALSKYFPKNLDFFSGFIVDSNDKISNQIDIIVSDKFKTPIFYENESIRVVPVECVYSVIEVKSRLDSKGLQECFENMASVRRLEKNAYSNEPPYDQFIGVNQYGRDDWPIWPVNYYVFAIDSIDLNTLTSTVEKKFAEEKAPLHSRIDTICVLKKGMICNEYPDGMFDALPGLGSRLTCIPTSRALLLFYSLIGVHLCKTQLPFFELHNYIEKVPFDWPDLRPSKEWSNRRYNKKVNKN
jgi:hypothetical protein